MIWILGFIAVVAGISLRNLLLPPESLRSRTRQPLTWRKTPRVRRTNARAVAPATASADMDVFAPKPAAGSGTYDPPSAGLETYDPPAAGPDHSTSDSPSCDSDPGGSWDSGDCGSGGSSFD
ncbi:MAG TPA: hypothetical protein VFR37_18685 [Longimicrobium sp.]|nr:hypothetical protein [Longimicrobium sp.]